MKSKLFLPGEKIGKLTIICLDHIEEKYVGKINKKQNEEYYKCKCECGNECVKSKKYLKCKKYKIEKNCGCLIKKEIKVGDKIGNFEVIKLHHIKH